MLGTMVIEFTPVTLGYFKKGILVFGNRGGPMAKVVKYSKTGPERGSLERAIVGALRSAIHAHGPITEDNVAGAGKRILCSLYTWQHNKEKDSGEGKNPPS
jgi:hypothetical protein